MHLLCVLEHMPGFSEAHQVMGCTQMCALEAFLDPTCIWNVIVVLLLCSFCLEGTGPPFQTQHYRNAWCLKFVSTGFPQWSRQHSNSTPCRSLAENWEPSHSGPEESCLPFHTPWQIHQLLPHPTACGGVSQLQRDRWAGWTGCPGCQQSSFSLQCEADCSSDSPKLGTLIPYSKLWS